MKKKIMKFNIKSVVILPVEKGGYMVKLKGGVDGKESLSVYVGSFKSCVDYALDIIVPQEQNFYDRMEGKNDL